MEKKLFFLQDLVYLLKEKIENFKSKETSDDEFTKGIIMGLYESLDLIKQQASAFEIPLSEIGLENYDLESFL